MASFSDLGCDALPHLAKPIIFIRKGWFSSLEFCSGDLMQ